MCVYVAMYMSGYICVCAYTYTYVCHSYVLCCNIGVQVTLSLVPTRTAVGRCLAFMATSSLPLTG